MAKKVLFVVNTLGRAGAERALCSLLSCLDLDRCEVTLLSLIGRGEMLDEIPPGVEIANRRINRKSLMTKGARVYLTLLSLLSLFKGFYIFRNFGYLKKNYTCQKRSGDIQYDKLFWDAIAARALRLDTQFDLAVAYMEGGSTYYVSRYVNAKKKVAFVHIDYQKSGYVGELDKEHFAAMDKIFCVSRTVLDIFNDVFSEFAEKTEVFHNIVIASDIEKKAVLKKAYGSKFTGTRLLTVGRLHYQKGYDIAVKAAALLVKSGFADFRWYVIGEGAERAALEAQIKAEGLQEQFILLGMRENPYPYIKDCDLYVQTSRFEGWCIAITEALTLKKLVVATRCAGVEEQIKHGETGYIIELSPQNIATAVMEVLNNEPLRKTIIENVMNLNLSYRDIDKLYNLLDN